MRWRFAAGASKDEWADECGPLHGHGAMIVDSTSHAASTRAMNERPVRMALTIKQRPACENCGEPSVGAPTEVNVGLSPIETRSFLRSGVGRRNCCNSASEQR